MDTTIRTSATPAIGVQQGAGTGVTVKSQRELDLMWEAGQIVGLVHKVLRAQVAAGMTTRELDAIAEREIVALGGKLAFKGYRGFPATLCVSINDEIVHGIPGDTVIADGDLVSLDLGAIVGGLYGDAAITVPVGPVSDELTALLEAGEASRGPASAKYVRAGVSGMCPRPSRPRWSGAGITASCADTPGTASAGGCTRSQACPTSASRAAATCCRPAWPSRSSRWSTSARTRRVCWTTTGRS